MKISASNPRTRGFTLVELMITLTVVVIAGGIAYSVLTSSLTLYAKNVTLNLSADAQRRSIDRLLLDVQNSNTMPVLINSAGGVVSSGAAAGIRYDSYLGGPYVLNHPNNGTSLAANSTVIRLYRHTHALASPPIPEPDDVLVVIGHEDRRFVVSSVTTGNYAANSTQTITVTLRAATGTVIPLGTSTVTAYLMRQNAMVVVLASGTLELRHYPHSERVTNYSITSNYRVITNTLNAANSGITPFTIQTVNSLPHVVVNLSIREPSSGNYMAGKQRTDANDYLFINTRVRPKMTL